MGAREERIALLENARHRLASLGAALDIIGQPGCSEPACVNTMARSALMVADFLLDAPPRSAFYMANLRNVASICQGMADMAKKLMESQPKTDSW
jgi:hypothetical protein